MSFRWAKTLKKSAMPLDISGPEVHDIVEFSRIFRYIP